MHPKISSWGDELNSTAVYLTPGGGGTRSGFIRGCAAPGSEPLSYFRESRTPKTYPYFREISQSRAPEAVRTQKTYPIIITLGKFDKITPYFREIW